MFFNKYKPPRKTTKKQRKKTKQTIRNYYMREKNTHAGISTKNKDYEPKDNKT